MATINIRVTKKEKAELQAIAASMRKTLSAYLRDAAQQEAYRVICLRDRAMVAEQETEAKS